jgi:uncharacterized protein (TIGR03435 family)
MGRRRLVPALALVILASLRGVAQSTPMQDAIPPSPGFDVISVRESKPVPPFSVGSINPPHSGRFSATNYSAMILIQVAYGFSSTQISEVPEWVHSARFEIRAQADPSVDNQLAKLSDEDATLVKQHMLQRLLAERFNLRVHTTTKKLPAYALVVAKGGPKLRKAKMEEPSLAQPNAAKPHPIEERSSAPGTEYLAHGASMELLAAHLTGQVGTTVLDKTGLTGYFDFTLQCCGDQQADNSWPSIYTALPEQLGLRLQPIKDPVPFLVIDEIERPSAN